MQSVKALIAHVKLPLKEADALVLHSKAWAAEYDSTIQLRNDIFDALEELE
jgi:hypothetical protein